MSRTALLDPSIKLDDIKDSGLLIGSYLSSSHLLGLFIAPTPVEAEEEGESLAERPEVKSGGDLDVPWMLEHAKQVLKMLPGGVHVVGFVFNSSQDCFTKSESKIKKLLSGLRSLDPELDETVFLLPSLKAKSLQADNIKNLDFKVSEEMVEMVELDTTLVLDVPIAFNCDQNASKMLHSHAQKGIDKFERALSSSICLFDNQLRGQNEAICPPQFGNKKKGKGKQRKDEDEDETEEGNLKVSVSILVQDSPNLPSDVVIEDNNIRLKLAGKMKSRTYVPKGSSMSDCKNAVLSDVKRSLRSRIRMHCDSLVGEEGEEGESGDGPIVHEPPRRILTRLPGTSICISDYLYPGEGGEDSIESIKEIFGFTPNEEDIEDDLEIVAAAKDVKMNISKSTVGEKSKRSTAVFLALSLGVAALSSAFAWFRLGGGASDEDTTEAEL